MELEVRGGIKRERRGAQSIYGLVVQRPLSLKSRINYLKIVTLKCLVKLFSRINVIIRYNK